MKRILCLLCLFCTFKLNSCQECFDSVVNIRKTIDDIIDASVERKEFDLNEDQVNGIRAGMKSGLKTALKIINTHHKETNLSLEKWEDLLE